MIRGAGVGRGPGGGGRPGVKALGWAGCEQRLEGELAGLAEGLGARGGDAGLAQG